MNSFFLSHCHIRKSFALVENTKLYLLIKMNDSELRFNNIKTVKNYTQHCNIQSTTINK